MASVERLILEDDAVYGIDDDYVSKMEEYVWACRVHHHHRSHHHHHHVKGGRGCMG